MTRSAVPLLLVALLLLLPVLAGCGDDDDATVAAARPGPVARVDLGEARRILERGGVELTLAATSGRASLASEVSPRPVDSGRLTTARGPKFDLLAFATPAAARRAWRDVLDTDVIEEGGVAIRAVNLVAAFPPEARDDVYPVVARRLRALAVACGPGPGDAGLRAACFGEDAGRVPPPGTGTAIEALAPIGATVEVGGVAYEVTLARQLNPAIEPDDALLRGYRPVGDSLLFGVVLRACNPSGPPVVPTARLRLVGAFGAEAEPVDLPAANPFGFTPRRLERGDCLPPPDSAADRTIDGALVLFAIPRERLEERPLALQIVSPDGTERALVQLDV